ncbi:claudin-10 [Hypomesus transpacificus]|uniref:claudin-10 n=1 Tax=Hypomesus transpacificus TaxID=137520 RepID=UPI001F07ACEB|nr:claudin-10 [Hypomesus transpacificus]
MKYRTVVMYMEIGCFVSCLSGWILVCSTLPTEYWTFSEVGTVVLTTANYYANLWKDCVSDTTGVSDCKEYPSLMGLPVFLHVCRALAVCSVITGFFAAVLTLVGMKCTKIGGSEIANARVTFAGAITYVVSGFCGLITYSLWGNKIRREFVDPTFHGQKYEIGAAVFIGWGGSLLLISGGAVMSYFSGREGLHLTSNKKAGRPATYATARTVGTRRTYTKPALSRVPVMPPLYPGGRDSRRSGNTRTMRSFGRDDFV